MSEEDRAPANGEERARLQKALRESVLLRELATILNSSLDLEHILQALVERTTELCDVVRCGVWLLEEPWKRFRPVTYHIASPALAQQMLASADALWYRSHLPINNLVIQRLLTEGGMLYISDSLTEPSVQSFAETFQARSFLLIALTRGDHTVGMMSLDNPGELRHFSQEQIQLARVIGQQATIAIDNARLYQQAQAEQQRAEKLIERARAIYQVAMTVNSGEELPSVLRLATGHLVRALEAQDGIPILLEPDETTLRPLGPFVKNPGTTLPMLPLSLDRLPNFRQAIRAGKPILVAAAQADENEKLLFQRFELQNILVVPFMSRSPHQGANWDLAGKPEEALLETREEILLDNLYCPGFIAIHYSRSRGPTRGEYAFAQDIAAQCALAIEKARLLTEAQQAANLANERANTLDAVFQAMTEGITVLTADEQILVRNYAAARLFGTPVSSSSSIKNFLHQHPSTTLEGKPITYEEFPLTRALHGTAEVQGERFITTKADGTRCILEITATPLRNVERQQVGLVSAFRDITVQVQAEERIREALEALREADIMKDEFLAITAHEFRNPLTVILTRSQGALRLLHRATDGALPPIAEHLETIAGQTKQLNNIVTTFLDSARLHQGQLVLNMTAVDLGKIAQQVVKDQSNPLAHHTLRCVLHEEQQPHLVLGDQARLSQIIANLVENAIKYSPLGGSITVNVRRQQNQVVEVRVQDEGMGIPPDAQARLFERFYRVPHTASSQTRGVGLGLYIVAQLVEMHGGHIRLESSGVPGEGSCFLVTLPALADPPQSDLSSPTT